MSSTLPMVRVPADSSKIPTAPRARPWPKVDGWPTSCAGRRILDGLEPLQDPHQGSKDPSVQRLIEELADDNAGLCVITTREPVKEPADFRDTTLEAGGRGAGS